MLAAARIATELGMAAFAVADDQRAAYHAAASISSNFLVTLEADAERLAASAGISRLRRPRDARAAGPATVENWIELGPERALTGPVARGDQATVAAQRKAIAERRPSSRRCSTRSSSAPRPGRAAVPA